MANTKELIITNNNNQEPNIVTVDNNNKNSYFGLLPIGKWAGKYTDYINAPIKTVFDNLRFFATNQKETSDKVLNVIDKAIDIMDKELQKDQFNGQEKKEIREKVCTLVSEARKESQEARLFGEGLALLGGSIALVGLGFGIMAYETRRTKHRQMLAGEIDDVEYE